MALLLRTLGVSALATVLPGRDGWYYWLGEDGHSLDRHLRGVRAMPQAEIDATVRELARRRAWLAERGIAYVVAVVPEKFTIYPEHLPAWVTASPAPTPLDRLRDALARDGSVNFVDLRPALRAAKANARVYYKTDSHWNYNGAVVGYDALMRAVQAALPAGALPAIVPAPRPAYVPGVDYFSGDLGQMLGLPGRVREDDVAPLGKVLADAANRCARRIDKGEFPGFEFFACDRPGLPRAVVLRDSMAIPLIPLLSENFSRVVYASTRKLDRALIEREKPDIVIEELVERSLHAPGALPMAHRTLRTVDGSSRVRATLLERTAATRRLAAHALAQLRLEAEFLDLARQRVAAPAQPRGRFHPVPAGMGERAADQRLLELVLETVADVALAAGQRLPELAVERMLPVEIARLARDRRRLAHLRRQVGHLDALARAPSR